ncbi:MAG: alpha/beta fold hydrolase [Xanthomonadales bacterium]|jgi:pimeloyl-ACP methyl ester carboxylesterase|nr:alpha/beta fold hydrolase [Xanthomonadales bacterium]
MKKVLTGIALFLLLSCSTISAQDPAGIPDPNPGFETTLLDSETRLVPESETGMTVDIPADLFARDSYRLDPVICPFKGKIDYKPGDFDCFLLEVPENRENPESRFIELHVVRINSRWAKEDFEDKTEETGLAAGKRNDPVIYLTGGPGVKASYYVRKLRDHGILDHRDLYILEQRGIGFSDDFCPMYAGRKPAADEAATFEESLEAANQRMRFCADNARAAGVDLQGYNTIENARDVKALRQALGLGQWNVWGISYGSILGQAYVKEDPEGILAVALDAIMPLDVRDSDEHWRVVKWYDRDLVKIQAICDSQPACADRYPDIGGRLRQAVASVVDQAIEIEVEDTESYPSGKARFFQNIVAMLPFVFLYEQENYPAMAALVYAWADAVERRDKDLFLALAVSMRDDGFFSSSQGMSNAIHCADGGIAAQARANLKDQQAFPVLGAALGTTESNKRKMTLCEELGMPLRAGDQYRAVQTSLPSLIIEGEMDPITPPPNAKAILPGFENGTYVEFPYAGHGPSRSVKCGGAMLNKFFDDPAAEPDLSCVNEMEVPEMIAPIFESSVVPRLLVLAEQDKKKLALPGAWLGGSMLISLLAFLVLTFSPLVRLAEGRPAILAGAARTWAWLAAGTSVTAVTILGVAIGMAADTSEILPLFGFMPWAVYGAWTGLATGVLGLLTIWATFRARKLYSLPGSRVMGFTLTGLAAVALSAFLLAWDLGPF